MARKNENLNWDIILQQIKEFVPIKEICKRHHIGEIRLKRLLSNNNIDISKRKRPPRNIPSRNILGEKFNWLTITGFHQKKDSQWWMEILCDCGNKGTELLRKLKNGQRKTCGISGCPHFHELRKTNGRSGNFTGYEEIYGSRWKGWECSAIKRNIVFDITPKYAWHIFIEQNRKCALSGVPIIFGNSWNKKITASLDRIDSFKGYVEGNVQWVHKHINMMKRDSTDEKFIKWCQQVVDYNRTPTNAK